MRQPFPGPGLAVRCLGELTKEKLDILRKADFIFRDEMAKAKLDRKAQQFFAVMTNVKSVGVRNGARTFGYVIAIRAISTSQFVKAGIVELPFKFVTMVAEKIATKVKGVNRVVWDITPKPPAGMRPKARRHARARSSRWQARRMRRRLPGAFRLQ